MVQNIVATFLMPQYAFLRNVTEMIFLHFFVSGIVSQNCQCLLNFSAMYKIIKVENIILASIEISEWCALLFIISIF